MPTVDLALVGGGLANGLLALALARRRPRPKMVLLEGGETIGGVHTWSFHETDLTRPQRELVGPLVSHSWPSQDVRFPGLERTVETPYHSVRSERLHEAVLSACGEEVRLGAEVSEVGPTRVELASGERFEARAVIDGRGFRPSPHLELGYQKFLGCEVELDEPHGLERPLLMDATIEQPNAFRFMYLLPFSKTRVLVEDTRYSDEPELEREAMRDAILGYVHDRLGAIRPTIVFEEEGCLPVVLSGDIERFWEDDPDVPRAGLRAALFHATTGYSLAEAARLAESVSSSAELDASALYRLTRGRSRALWNRSGFYRLLNRMLFRAARPAERYRVLQRFYKLPRGLIERFYAGRTSALDKLRILTGRPPVPVARAVRCLVGARLEPLPEGTEP